MRKLLWVSLLGALTLPVTAAAAAANAKTVVLVTHPRAAVLHYYATLVRQEVIDASDLELVGIHHSSETEDYSDAAAYLAREKIDFIRLQTVDCALDPCHLYTATACRQTFADLVQASSGLILNGGPDIPPAMYDEPTLLTTVIETPRRHQFELALLAHLLGTARNRSIVPLIAARPDYAVLGICVGMQSLNVADGGSLYQDIPSEIYGEHTLEQVEHSPRDTWHRNCWAALDPEPAVAAGIFHPIRLQPSAPAALRLIGAASQVIPHVMSIHHQSVKRLGADYQVTADSLDGKVVEGIRHRRFAHVFGWQFHPERPNLWNREEVGKMNETDPDRNFAWTVLQSDDKSRAFNLALWQSFLAAVASSRRHQGELATPPVQR